MRLRALFIMGAIGACAEPAARSEADREHAGQIIDADADAPRCTLPVAALAGPGLEPFHDADELGRYLRAHTASCFLRNQATPQREGEANDAPLAGARAELAQPAAEGADVQSAQAASQIAVLESGGRLHAVDLSVAGAPRHIGATRGGGLSGFATLPASHTLRPGDLLYTFDQVTVPEPSAASADLRSGQSPAGSPSGGAPAPRPRQMALEITTHAVREDALVELDRSYFELGRRGSATDLTVRVVDGALVLGFTIAPTGAPVRDEAAGYVYQPLVLPRRLRRDPGTQRLEPTGPMLTARDVLRPLPLVDVETIGAHGLTLNTLMRCKPAADGPLACVAKAHLGPLTTHLLTSRTRSYAKGFGRIYAWHLADGTLSAHRIEGAPSYLVAALEVDDTLHVPLFAGAYTVGARETLSMASLPLSSFDKHGAQSTPPRLLLRAAGPTGRMSAHGFIGTTYAASLTGYSGDPEAETTLLLYDVRAGAAPQVTHDARDYVSFRPLGPDRALLVSQPSRFPAARDARLEVWTLGPAPQLRSAYVLSELWPGWLQAYRGRADGSGLFAVAVDTRVENNFGIGPPRLGWFSVSEDHQLTLLGWLDDRACGEARCSGWSRGMFVGDRPFAMSRDAIQELTVDAGVRLVGVPARLTSP